VARNLLEPQSVQAEYGAIPRVAFCVAPLASVGVSPRAAEAAGISVRVAIGDHSHTNTLRKLCATCAGYKLLIDRQSDQLVGAHLLGPGAEEMINLLAVAMEARYPAQRLKQTLLAFPTLTSAVREML
jgi:glutathione reductase (NADPH)